MKIKKGQYLNPTHKALSKGERLRTYEVTSPDGEICLKILSHSFTNALFAARRLLFLADIPYPNGLFIKLVEKEAL